MIRSKIRDGVIAQSFANIPESILDAVLQFNLERTNYVKSLTFDKLVASKNLIGYCVNTENHGSASVLISFLINASVIEHMQTMTETLVDQFFNLGWSDKDNVVHTNNEAVEEMTAWNRDQANGQPTIFLQYLLFQSSADFRSQRACTLNRCVSRLLKEYMLDDGAIDMDRLFALHKELRTGHDRRADYNA